LLACGAYLVLSGGSVSTQRAFIMAAVAFGAILIDRSALSMRSLSIAMVGIILLAPWSVLTPGFQMSFSATAALIATYEMWRARQDMLGDRPSGVMFWVKSLIVTSVVSSVATAPFALYHFDRVAGLGVLANLAAMPIISLISAPLAGAALLLAPFGADQWALRAFGWSLESVLFIAHFFSNSENGYAARFAPMPGISLIIFAAAIGVYTLSEALRAKAVTMLLLAGLAGVVWGLSATDRIHWAPSGELFLEHASGRVERLTIRKGDGLAPLRFADYPDTPSAQSAPCARTFGDARLSLCESSRHSDDTIRNEPMTIPVRPPSTASSISIRWEDVLRENGVTLERRGQSFVKRRKPACGQRPWRLCLAEPL